MREVMTLAIHLVWSAIWRSWVARILNMVAVLLQLLDATGRCLVLTRDLRSGLVTNRWELNGSLTWLVTLGRGTLTRRLTFSWCADSLSSSTLFFGLALVLLLLLASLPFLSDLLELCSKSYVSTCMLHKISREFGYPLLAPAKGMVKLSPDQDALNLARRQRRITPPC